MGPEARALAAAARPLLGRSALEREPPACAVAWAAAWAVR